MSGSASGCCIGNSAIAQASFSQACSLLQTVSVYVVEILCADIAIACSTARVKKQIV